MLIQKGLANVIAKCFCRVEDLDVAKVIIYTLGKL
jgi:hypothetical protein